MENMQVAKAIINQLGGGQFVTMTGARNFVVIDNGVRFTIGMNGSKANLVRIKLNEYDTYDVEFWSKGRDINLFRLTMKYINKGYNNDEIKMLVQEAERKAEPKMLKSYNGVYCDQLQEIFTNYTKLYTHL